MKALKILIILSVFLVFLPDLEAICCESSCSDFANICCTPPGGGSSVGYVGCWDATTSQYVCPGTAIGECLECGTNSCDPNVECSWNAVTQGSCNACEITYDNENYPVNSMCSTACGAGETKCADGSCLTDCDIPPTVPPNCDPLDNNDQVCCVDPNNNPDGTCDANCLLQQDIDCSGEIPSHAECNIQQQCVQVSGAGNDLCNSNSCLGVPPTPNHKTCGANGNCLTISGFPMGR